MKLNFFDVDKQYVEFLQNAEFDKRGFSCVPNMEYQNREQKFLCGIVLKIDNFNYYVPVTSYKQKQSENVLIRFDDDKTNQIKGSLRFNYMIPVPDECIQIRSINSETDPQRRRFLARQLKYIRSIEKKIFNQAQKTYSRVVNGSNMEVKQYACDFKLLEEKCLEYENQMNNYDEEFDSDVHMDDELEL